MSKMKVWTLFTTSHKSKKKYVVWKWTFKCFFYIVHNIKQKLKKGKNLKHIDKHIKQFQKYKTCESFEIVFSSFTYYLKQKIQRNFQECKILLKS